MEEKQQTETKQKLPIKRTITGGVVGATIGYLATPENGKKLVTRIQDADWKEKGTRLSESTKSKWQSLRANSKRKSQQTIQKVKNATTKDRKAVDEDDEENISTELVNEESYLELKEENKLLQERLKSLEEKLNKVASENESSDSENEKSTNSGNSKSSNGSKTRAKKTTATRKTTNTSNNTNKKTADDTNVSKDDDTKSE